MVNFSKKDIAKSVLKHVVKNAPVIIAPTTAIPLKILGAKFDSPHRRSESIVEKLLHENVEPGVGALIYCELFTAEHSGIYLGNNQIAQLSGKGNIEIVSPAQFTSNITTLDRDIFIPVTRDGSPIHCKIAAHNARIMIGHKRNYNLLLDNCHQFSAGCITGNFENNDNFLVFAKQSFYDEVGTTVKWKRWKWMK